MDWTGNIVRCFIICYFSAGVSVFASVSVFYAKIDNCGRHAMLHLLSCCDEFKELCFVYKVIFKTDKNNKTDYTFSAVIYSHLYKKNLDTCFPF